MQYQYIDIFAGCGGLSLGLYQAGWHGLFAVEKNTDAFNTLKLNLIDNKQHFSWIDWLPMCPLDINEVLNNYTRNLKSINSMVQLVVGGPPCQGFSMAGLRQHSDSRNQLVDSYIEFIRMTRPNYLFFENVHGITVGFKDGNMKISPTSNYIIEKLKIIGYKIDCKILDLSEFGVPQKRKRFILIGSTQKNPSRLFKILNDQKTSFLQKKQISLYTSMFEAISDLSSNTPIAECPDDKRFILGTYKPISSKYQELMRQDIINKSIPNSHRFARHRKESLELFTYLQNNYPVGKRLSTKNISLTNFKRRGLTILDSTTVCNTITSNPDDYLHYNEPRILTVREYARIQSFPDWYIFTGKYTTGGKLRKYDVPRYTQVANAIPPLFAEQIGLALIKLIEE